MNYFLAMLHTITLIACGWALGSRVIKSQNELIGAWYYLILSLATIIMLLRGTW